MKIDNGLVIEGCAISALASGDTFLYESDLYILTEQTQVDSNESLRVVVRLFDGQLTYLDREERVISVPTRVVREG